MQHTGPGIASPGARPRLLLPALAVTAAALLARFAFVLALRGPLYVSKHYMADDAFYYFQVARNIARGMGSSFDGVHATNGYHPGWLASVLPAFAAFAGSPAAPLTAVFAIQIVLIGAAAVLLYLGLRAYGNLAAAATVVLFLASGFTASVLFNGMESTLAFALLALLFYVAMRRGRRFFLLDSSSYAAFILLALAALAAARLEAALFALAWLAIAATVALRATGASRAPRLWRLLGVAAGLAVLAAGYVALNLAVSGLPLPVSGLVKSDWAVQASLDAKLSVVAMHLKTLAGLFPDWSGLQTLHVDGLRLAVILTALAAAAAWALSRAARNRRSPHETGRLLVLVPFAFLALCFAAAGTFFNAGGYWWYGWTTLFAAVLATFALAKLCIRVARGFEARHPRVRATALFAAAFAAVLLVSAALAVHSEAKTRTRLWDWGLDSVLLDRALDFTQTSIPPQERMAGPSVGLFAYFSGRSVEHTQGLINGSDFYDALRAGTIPEYLAANDVRWLVLPYSEADDLDAAIAALAAPCAVERTIDVVSHYGIEDDLSSRARDRGENVVFVTLDPSRCPP